jgi:hypothetical protein
MWMELRKRWRKQLITLNKKAKASKIKIRTKFCPYFYIKKFGKTFYYFLVCKNLTNPKNEKTALPF